MIVDEDDTGQPLYSPRPNRCLSLSCLFVSEQRRRAGLTNCRQGFCKRAVSRR